MRLSCDSCVRDSHPIHSAIVVEMKPENRREKKRRLLKVEESLRETRKIGRREMRFEKFEKERKN